MVNKMERLRRLAKDMRREAAAISVKEHRFFVLARDGSLISRDRKLGSN
jgi:hypothetical protein